MKRIILFIFVIVLISYIPCRAEKMRIAVMDLKEEGISKQTAKTVTNMIRTELINMGRFTVIERSQMELILKEQGIQQTGCADQECVVQIGKLMSAKKILIGEVAPMGKSMMVTMRIVDVEKGVSEFAAREKAEDVDDLDKAVGKITDKLVMQIEKGSGAVRETAERKTMPEAITPGGYFARGVVPGWAQLYSGHTVKGIAIGGIFLGSAIWTIMAVLKYYNSKDDYNSLETGLPQNKYNDAYDKYKKDGKIATYSLIGLSAVYIINWVDVIFFSKPDPGASLGLIRYDNVYVNFNINSCDTCNISGGLRTDLYATMKF